MKKVLFIVGLLLVVLLAVTRYFFGWSVAWQVTLCATTTVIFLAVAIYFDAKAGMHFTLLKETDIMFVIRGEELHKVLIGLKRTNSKKIRKGLKDRDIHWSDRESSWLAMTFGIHYVHWLYPQFRVYSFKILSESIQKDPKKDALMRDLISRHDKTVEALRWKFPRPVLVEGVELKDRITVDIIVMAFLEVEDPYIPVFTYRGDFFPLVASFVQSATMDLVVGEPHSLTYPEFVDMNKGEGSEFSTALCTAINKGGNTKDGLLKKLGIRVTKAFIFKYDLSAEQKKIEEAARAESEEQMRAKGVIARANGDAQARLINAETEAKRMALIVKALTDADVNPDEAARLARTLVKTENVRDSKLTTWVDAEGGIRLGGN